MATVRPLVKANAPGPQGKIIHCTISRAGLLPGEGAQLSPWKEIRSISTG
jgi:hypothetical protein